jgi:hypothetical protein
MGHALILYQDEMIHYSDPGLEPRPNLIATSIFQQIAIAVMETGGFSGLEQLFDVAFEGFEGGEVPGTLESQLDELIQREMHGCSLADFIGPD